MACGHSARSGSGFPYRILLLGVGARAAKAARVVILYASLLADGMRKSKESTTLAEHAHQQI